MRTHEPRQGKIDRSNDREDAARARRRRVIGGVAAAAVGFGFMYGHARGVDQSMDAASQARLETEALTASHDELNRVAAELAGQPVETDDPSIVATFELEDGQSIIGAVEGTGYSAPKEMFPHLLASAQEQGIVQPGDRFAITEHEAAQYSSVEVEALEDIASSFAVIQPLKEQEDAS